MKLLWKQLMGKEWEERNAVIEEGKMGGYDYLILKSPLMLEYEKLTPEQKKLYPKSLLACGYNGYIYFKKKPVKEPGYNGILNYVPVHGGITFAEPRTIFKIVGDKKELVASRGMAYGFDTAHSHSGKFPISDVDWIKKEIAIMLKGIQLASKLEDEYLLAEGDNQKRAEIVQPILDLHSEGEELPFGALLNLLGGQL